MRRTLTAALLVSCALANACGGGGQSGASNNARTAAQSNSATKATAANSSNTSGEIGVASSHGGGAAAPAPGGAAGGSADRAPVSTPELDADVQKAEAKVKAGGASDADKKAAASAYFARADHVREQGMPQLYKFALADYRRGLRLDPSNSAARGKMEEIVQIYRSMGRSVPELGNEP